MVPMWGVFKADSPVGSVRADRRGLALAIAVPGDGERLLQRSGFVPARFEQPLPAPELRQQPVGCRFKAPGQSIAVQRAKPLHLTAASSELGILGIQLSVRHGSLQ